MWYMCTIKQKGGFMRKKVILSMFLSILLLASSNVLPSKALEYSEVTWDTNDFYLESTQLLKLEDDKYKENFSSESIKASTVENFGDSLRVESIGNATMLYGSQSGFLPSAGQYSLFPLDLTTGSYLQARLTPPIDSQIDYDLRLYDSSFNLLSQCDYLTAMREGQKTIEESLGYFANSDLKVYLCVISAQGGSLDKPYVLDMVVTTNASDSNEIDESASQATTLTFNNYARASVTRNLNSPVDNDWYVFNVEDSPAYDKMRLQLNNTSSNGAKIEIFQNLSPNPQYFGLLKLAEGNGGELDLGPGQYYLRVINTNSLESFNINDIGSYTLSIEPVGRVDLIQITYINGYNRTEIAYNQGYHVRIDKTKPSSVTVTGVTYYYDENHVKRVSPNARVHGQVTNTEWLDISRPDMAYTNKDAVSDKTGLFKVSIPLLTPLGGDSYYNPFNNSVHTYDYMIIDVNSIDNSNVQAEDAFYLLTLTSINPPPKNDRR